MRTPRTLARAARLLARYCPADRPVVLTPIRRLPWWADTCRYRDHYAVRLSAQMDPSTAVEVLAHEWAHAMTWRASRIDHGAAWGVAYSRCYRVVVEGWRPRR